jgi:hypothetical protein
MLQDDACMEEIGQQHANLGGQFLNSPHAKFTGTFAQIIDRSKYGSHFTEDAQGCSDPDPAYRTKALCTAAGATWYGCSDSKFFTPASCTENGKIWQEFVGAAAGVASDTTVARNAGCSGCHDPHIGAVDPDVLDMTNTLQIKPGHLRSKLPYVSAACRISYIRDPDYRPSGWNRDPLDGDLGNDKV